MGAAPDGAAIEAAIGSALGARAVGGAGRRGDEPGLAAASGAAAARAGGPGPTHGAGIPVASAGAWADNLPKQDSQRFEKGGRGDPARSVEPSGDGDIDTKTRPVTCP